MNFKVTIPVTHHITILVEAEDKAKALGLARSLYQQVGKEMETVHYITHCIGKWKVEEVMEPKTC